MEKRCCGCMQIKTQSPLCEFCGYNENVDNLPHQLPVDTVLQDRFRLGKVLGQGGFGITYIGWDEKEAQPVAVKEYYPKAVVDRNVAESRDVVCRDESGQAFFRQYREQFLQEAKTLEMFADVPQIVHVKTVFEENSTVYIAMEYVRGTDLRVHLRANGLLTPQQAFQIFRPVLEGLGKVHESGLVHKDISPDNIMILPDGQAKLLDFGAAQDVHHSTRTDTESQGAIAVVKHGFAPPEQYQTDTELGPWTDVYALCATMYYCMTGRIPKRSPDRFADKKLDWSAVAGQLPITQRLALEQGMDPQPGNRYHDVGELYQALFKPRLDTVTSLEEISDEEEAASRSKKKVRKKRKPVSKKRIAVIAACLLAAAGAAAYLMIPKGWAQEEGITCYYDMGERLTGMQVIEGNTYLFSPEGVMLTGWQEAEGKTYCFGTDGVMLSGSFSEDGMEYYFAEDGSFSHRVRVLSGDALASSESQDKASFPKRNGGTQGWTYQVMRTPVVNCTHLEARMEMTEYKNGNAEQWAFAYRDLNGEWHTLGEPFGLKNDRATLNWSGEEGITFDAYVWYCMSVGNMWNFQRSYALTEATVVDRQI